MFAKHRKKTTVHFSLVSGGNRKTDMPGGKNVSNDVGMKFTNGFATNGCQNGVHASEQTDDEKFLFTSESVGEGHPGKNINFMFKSSTGPFCTIACARGNLISKHRVVCTLSNLRPFASWPSHVVSPVNHYVEALCSLHTVKPWTPGHPTWLPLFTIMFMCNIVGTYLLLFMCAQSRL